MDKPIKLKSYIYKVKLPHYISLHKPTSRKLCQTHEIRKATFNIKACTVSHTHP